MSMSTANAKVEKIRQSIRASYDELNQMIESQLATSDSAVLYSSPDSSEWTLMENISHIIEFMPYWADEIEKLVATPGQNFGRTQQHEGRLKAIREHGADSLQQAKAALPGSYARLDQVLSTLKDSDLDLRGHHPKFGDQTLGWFIEEFVTSHLANHLEQMRACLAVIKAR